MSSNSNDKNNLLLNHIKNINKSDIELEQLKKENQVLKEENLKLKTEMTIKNENIPHNNNTSSNFFLISQIEQLWIEIGENNINECFVDYYSYPDILHEIICKIVNIIQSMISNTTSSIIAKFMNECNISTNNRSDYSFILKKIYVIIKEYHKEVFNTENSFESFKEEFSKFMKNEIYRKINNSLREQTEIEMNSNSFKSLYINLLNVIIFVEFSDNLMLRVNSKIKEIKNFKLPTSKCICVEGKFDKNKEYLVLLPSPTTQKGFVKYCQLWPIVIEYSNDVKNNSPSKLNQQIDLKLEIEINNKNPFSPKPQNKNINNNKVNSNNETIQNSTKKHLLTMRYFNTNYDFKVFNNNNKNSKKNENNNINHNNILNYNLNLGGIFNIKSPPTKSKRVSNIKKNLHKKNNNKFFSPQTEKKGNTLKNSKTNQIYTIHNNPSVIVNQGNHYMSKSSLSKKNTLNSQSIHIQTNNSVNNKNNDNNLSKSKHRSLLSLHYVRGDEDIPPKKAFIKIKEYIAHRITKHKQNNASIYNKHKKSNTNSLGDNYILNGLGCFYANNNKYNLSNLLFSNNNIYENERNNTTENINHLKLSSVSPSMGKQKQCYFKYSKN